MKSLICSAGILCLSATPLCLRAQDANLEKEKVHSPKFEIGLQTGINRSLGNDRPSIAMPNHDFNSINNGIFARYYFGKHFAIESGVNMATSAINPQRSSDIYYFDNNTVRKTINTRSFEVPVQLQYHLLSPDSKIRPYFGLGASYISHNYHIADKYYDAEGALTDNRTYNDSRSTLGVKFTQGVTWQINKNWQINQSLYLQRELAGHKNNIGLQLGVGYTIK